MRRTRTVVPLVLLALTAAACGGGGDDGSSSPSAATDATGPADSTAFPVTIEHRFGATTIEAAPERIVTVGLTDQDAFLALGVVPVGVTEWFGSYDSAAWPWALDELEALVGDGATPPEVVGNSDPYNFERIAALQPDLIVGIYAGLTEEQYETFSQIAPTVAQSDAYVDYGVPWQEQTRVAGRVVGRAEEADALVASVESKLAAAREANPAFADATGLVASPYLNGVYVYAAEDARGRFMTDLGFVQPPEIDELAGDEFSADVSFERLDLIDGDALVLIVNSIETDRARIESEPLFADRAVTREGRIVYVENLSDLGGATSFVTVLSVPFLLDELVPQLAAAVDGDPATTGQ